MKNLATFLLTVALCNSAFAQSTNSSGDYAMDLGQVQGGTRGAKFLGEICSDAFPEQALANATAYKQWREKYLPFLQEVDRHFSALAYREANGDPQKHVQFLADSEKSFDGYRDALRSQLMADGEKAFKSQCELFPTYLDSERMNLEKYYAEQVATMRAG